MYDNNVNTVGARHNDPSLDRANICSLKLRFFIPSCYEIASQYLLHIVAFVHEVKKLYAQYNSDSVEWIELHLTIG